MKKITTLLFLAFSFCVIAQTDQTVFNDPDFNAGGTGFFYEYVSLGSNRDIPTEILIQPDSKIIVAGTLTIYNGTGIHNIIRLNEDGSIDETFITGTGFNGSVNAMLFLTPETILIGGNFTSYNGTACNNMIILNLDGSVNSLNLSGTNGAIYDMLLQPDGKILFTGDFTSYNGIVCNHLGRLNADGILDNTFNVTLENTGWNALALQQDGKIIAGGESLYRFNSDGSHDTSFVENLQHSIDITSMYIDSQNDIYLSGRFITDIPLTNFHFPWRSVTGIIKVKPNGNVDESYHLPYQSVGNHSQWLPFFRCILPFQNSMLIGGFAGFTDYTSHHINHVYSNGYANPLFRYFEGPFNINYYYSDAIYNMAFLPNGDLIAIGTFNGGIFKINMPLLNIDNLKTREHDIISYNSGSILKLLSKDIQIKSVLLYDMSGRRVYQNQQVNANEISIANLSSGMYNAVITDINGSIQKLKCIKY